MNGCALLMSVINTVYGHHFSYNFRISVTNFLCAIFMIPLPFVTDQLEPELAFWVAVALFAIVGVNSGLA